MQTNTVGQIREKDNALFLRHVLRANTVFSVLSGVVVLMAAAPLSELMGINNPFVFYVLGMGLLPFAGFVFYTSQQTELNTRLVKIILVMDAFWVVGSYFLIFSGTVPFTAAGKWIVGLIAEVVFIFAILEMIGLRRLN